MPRPSRENWKVYNNVFDEFTIRNIFKLESQGHFTDLASSYKLGKEANVFLASRPDGKDVVVKIYRLENCNFNKMYGYLCQDERYESLKGQRRKIIFSWVQREFRNLLLAREAIRVPTPFAFKDNIIVMEMIGEEEPAQQLKDQPPKDLAAFLDEVIAMMKRLQEVGLVHGDLSAFNILNHEEEPVFIDFSQGTTIGSHGWEELLRRDVKNVLTYFRKLGVDRDEEGLYRELLAVKPKVEKKPTRRRRKAA